MIMPTFLAVNIDGRRTLNLPVLIIACSSINVDHITGNQFSLDVIQYLTLNMSTFSNIDFTRMVGKQMGITL